MPVVTRALKAVSQLYGVDEANRRECEVESYLDFPKVLRTISGSGVPSALRSSLALSALGLFGLFLWFLPFSVFYCADISCHYQEY